MAEDIQFSPVRVTASTEEAAIEQALALTGAARENIVVEVLEETDKNVTVRVRPRGGDEEQTPARAASAPRAADPDEDSGVDEDELDEDELDEDELDEDELDEDELDEDELDDGELDEDEEDNAPEGGVLAAEPAFDEAVMQAARERAETLAADLLERMALDVECRAEALPQWMIDPDSAPDMPRVFLRVEGEDVSILIGKRGGTLQSFQYLLNLTLNNHEEDAVAAGKTGIHVVVDAGDYRARRAAMLQQAAREAAERAKRERRPVRMEPLNGHERRLVHLALRPDPEVTTDSDGREPWRRVVVTPTNARGGAERGQERGNGGYAHSGRGENGRGRGNGGGRGGRGYNAYGSSRESGGREGDSREGGGRGYGRGRR